MTAIAWPAGLRAPAECTFIPEQRDTTAQGLYTGRRTTVPRYELWRAMLTWEGALVSELMPVYAHLARARGTQVALSIPHFGYKRNIAGATIGAITTTRAHTAGELEIDLSTALLEVGDFINQTNANSPRLHLITWKVGQTYGIWPRHRTGNNSGKTIEHVGQTLMRCTMSIPGGMPPMPSYPSPGTNKLVRGFAVEFEEHLDAGTLP